jgi:hypothetical protein
MANIQGISGSTPQLVGTQITADPALSPVFVSTYRGEKTMLRAYTDSVWIPDGAKVTLDESGPMGIATVTYARNPSTQENDNTISVRWDISTDRVDVSLFSLPAVNLEANTYISVAQYRTDIEDAAKNGTTLTMSAANFPLAYIVWDKLSRGQDSFPTTRVSLTRSRTFSTQFAVLEPLTSFPPIYTTAGLISEYSVPAVIQAILPSPPANVPAKQQWGWLQTDRSTNYTQKTNSVEERYSWAFFAADLDIYEFSG